MKQSQRKEETRMKLVKKNLFRSGNWLGLYIMWIAFSWVAYGEEFITTTVQGTVYSANGQPGTGSLQLSWPAFTTASNQAVTAGRKTVTIGSDGFVSVNLAPNVGATPAGLYYTAIYNLSDGTTSTEYWVVPSAARATLGQVRAQLMPAAQAVQAVSKKYVDQSIQELTQSLLTAAGGNLSGPLYLNGDPQIPTQAASKHYVDSLIGQTVSINGGAVTGPLTSVKLGAAYQVDQFHGNDFGTQLQECIQGLDQTYGGTCDARNFTGNQSLGSDLTISTGNVTVHLPCATISTAHQIVVTAGTRNVTFHGCGLRGASAASGSQGGTVFLYSGTGAMVQVGDRTYASNTPGFHFDNAVINTTASSASTAQALVAYRTQELDLENLYFLGNSNQTGVTLDGTGNYTGGTFQDDEFGGFGTAINAIGHQTANSATTDWMNASAFVRLHINCPTSGGNPISGTYGINLQQGDGNTFTGGDVEGCSIALHLGSNAQNNTIVGLRNENSTYQVMADAGSSYNNWMTGGTMFTGKLMDNGTRNSFLDTFHRSFNGINGDWYGSQQDATLTNHFRIGIGNGNERGLLNRYQTDSGYRWTTGLSDATAGEQFYQVLDELNSVYRLSIGQYNGGQASTNNQTVVNAAGTGAIVLNGSANAGTGGVVFGSGGSGASTVATINNAGNAQFNGTLQVGGPSTFLGSTTVKNQDDSEIDAFLWAGATKSQKESLIYKDWNGSSQWYMVKDASNNWALNSATGGLDSFKAYQSYNSGDTYINASNGTGHIRLNYESGSGAETDVYSGSGSSLVAAFLGPTAIKLPGLASTNGKYCLQIDNSGYISNAGTGCGTGSGTVNAGAAGQIAYYTGNGSAVAGTGSVAIAAGGTGATTAGQALANLGGQVALTGVSADGASGMRVAGNVAAATTTTSVNKVLMVTASPYNAYCDAASPGTLTMTAGSAVTSGVTFTNTDVGKVITAGGQANGIAYRLQATILSVSGGNATLSAAATVSFAAATGHWHYGHDDQPGIQAAFNDALANTESVQFPAGTCMTSAITYKGQSFFGAGMALTTVMGMPGQDVFASPDSAITMSNASIHDLTIGVDTSLNKASAAVGGDNTFPNRISGTAGGTTPLSNPIQTDGFIFGAGTPTNCYGSMTSGSATLSLCGTAYLTSVPPSFVIGQPVSVSNAGPSGGGLTSTVVSITNASTVVLADPASSTTTTGTGYIGTPSTVASKTPWYFGNCAIALPSSNGAALATFSNATIRNVQFGAIHRAYPNENFTCAMFMQANEYDNLFDNVTVFYQWGGLIEAPPASNNTSYFAWTPDTNVYNNVNFYQNSIPMVWYNGAHRTATGINIYSLGIDFGVGLFQIGTGLGSSATNYPSASISRYYNECNTWNGGEIARFSGQDTIGGGSLGQCASKGYVNWLANTSTVGAALGPSLRIGGFNNTFTNSGLQKGQVTDTGWNNRVIGGPNTASPGRSREQHLGTIPVPPPVGSLDGSFLAGGLSSTPILNMSDLLTGCNDYYVVTSGAFGVSCVNDPSGTELTKNYMHASGSGGFFTQGSVNNYALLTVGSRFPQTQVYAVTQGMCEGTASCTGTLTIQDITTGSTTIKSCLVTYSSTWIIDGGPNSAHPCLVNLASTSPLVSYGDEIGFSWSGFSGSPAAMDLAYLAYMPVNSDVLTEVLQSPILATALANTAQTGGSGAPVILNAKNWFWGSSNPGVADANSPVGYSTAVTNAATMTGANGGTNLNAGYGGMVQAAPSIVTSVVQSTTTVSNTLASPQLVGDTTVAVTNPSNSSWPTNGCLMVDQELECYTGPLAVGTTSIPVARGQWTTTAQGHASGTLAPLAPHGRVNVICNGVTIGSDQVIFANNWSAYSAYIPLQYCSGYPVAFQIGSLTDVPSGQITKIASISVAQTGSNTATPTAANQVPVSAQISTGPFSYSNSKTLAGNGAGIVTGPISATVANHGTCYNDAVGTTKDCGYAPVNPTAMPLSGTALALTTSAIAAGTCSSTQTVTVSGATSTMVAELTPTADESTVTGYGAGGLSVKGWITANTVNVKVCNQTQASITPGALTVNVRVIQ